MKEFLDKVLLALLATIVSTYVLYSFNLYNKAFETAQDQSHSYSRLAEKLYALVIDDLATLLRNIKVDQLSGSSPLSDTNKNELLRLANDVKTRASALRVKLAGPSQIALRAADELRDAVPHFATAPNFTRTNVDAFTNQISIEQTEFIESYNAGIGPLLAMELANFQTAYTDNIPWQARPTSLLLIMLAGTLFYFLLLWFSPSVVRES
jgi:hypothetical protein